MVKLGSQNVKILTEVSISKTKIKKDSLTLWVKVILSFFPSFSGTLRNQKKKPDSCQRMTKTTMIL